MQTRIQSLVEQFVNIAIGATVSIIIQILVYPLYGFSPSLNTNLQLTAIFTIASIARGYCVRRWFNKAMSKLWEYQPRPAANTRP